MTDELKQAAAYSIHRLHLSGVMIPASTLAAALEIKTLAFYRRAIYDNMVRLWKGDQDEYSFIETLSRIIEEQFIRAMREGALSVGVEAADIPPDVEEYVIGKMGEQQDFLYQFAQDIVSSRETGKPADFAMRVDMWANRYNEIVNDVSRMINKKQRLRWKLGKTEDHCLTCSYLDGLVAYAAEWDESGYHPQGAPNEQLQCGGWQCDCSLEPTDSPRTRGIRDKLGLA